MITNLSALPEAKNWPVHVKNVQLKGMYMLVEEMGGKPLSEMGKSLYQNGENLYPQKFLRKYAPLGFAIPNTIYFIFYTEHPPSRTN